MLSSMLRLHSILLLAGTAVAQGPEIIHYSFDSGDVSNSAVPGVGDGSVVGGVSFVTGNSCSAGSAGAASSTGMAEIDAGWAVDLGTDSWTIGMHLDLTVGGNGFQYYFGSESTGGVGGMRCFSAGAAGPDGIIMRTLQDDVILPGGALAGSPTHVAWVYDNTVPEVRGYVDGVNVVTVAQSAPINLVGTLADFKVMNFSTNMLSGNVIDDFRIYRRAINQAEINAWVGCNGGGIGTNYCGPGELNTTGMSGIMSAGGSDVAADMDLTLTGTQLPPSEFAYFIGSLTQGFVAMPGGSSGNLCVLGAIARFNTQIGQTSAAGEFSIVVDTQNIPVSPIVAILPGDTWNFQCWHRDFIPMVGATSNFTDGISITFQ